METSGSCSFPSVPSRTDAENVDGQGHTSTLNSIEEEVSKNVLHGEDDVDITEPPHKKVKSVSDNAPTKGKKKRSVYWEHFSEIVKNGEKRAKCNYCHVDVCGDSKKGTTVMKNHIVRCKEYPPNIDRSQRLICLQGELSNQLGDDDSVDQTMVNAKKGKLELWKFKQEDSRKAFAKMIIMDELPFRFSEREGFRLFMSVAQPNFIIPSRFTVARDCFQLYLGEQKKLKHFFSMCSSRISLTTDTWTSGHNLCYMCLTAHFIDQDWKLHKKILNFCPISGHSGEVIGKAVEKCLLEWGISRVLTITVDNASANDVGIEYLRKRFLRWKDGTVLSGKFIHMRCASHILNLTVKEGLKECDTAIARVRNAVRFVKSSPARMQKFRNCVNQEQILSKRQVILDVETRWNSTYMMLDFASVFRRAFDLLESSDGGKFVSELNKSGGVPTDEDWDRICAFLPFLKLFYDATLRLSGSLYVTSNMYLEEIVTVGRMIKYKCTSSDMGESLMASGMRKKFEKYWENVDKINLLWYVAAVLDPRKKMQYVEWALDDMYDVHMSAELLVKIKETLNSLYEHYASQHSQIMSKPSDVVDLTQDVVESIDDWYQRSQVEFEMHVSVRTNLDRKNDLTKYLDEERESSITGRHLDVLDWWRRKAEFFPVVALIARDVLAIPVSTVASESAFTTGGRVLDPFRSSLSPRMVEALVCTQDWLRKGRGPLLVEEIIEDLERIEEETALKVISHPCQSSMIMHNTPSSRLLNE